MEAMQALVIMEHELTDLLTKTGKIAAAEILEAFRQEINQDPIEKHATTLRNYIEDRTTLKDPRNRFAHGHHIRLLNPAKNNKPKSIAWFQNFKKESQLKDCPSRASTTHGRLQEWCFEDIANAWDYYHRQRWLKE